MRWKKVPIRHMDDNVIVCVKPAGLPVQSDYSRDMDMTTLLKHQIIRDEELESEPYLTAVHRLDRPVGGLIVFARTKKAAADLSRQIREGEFEKNYQAVLCGELPEETATWEDELIKDGKTNETKVVEKGTPGAKHALLDIELIDCIETKEGPLSWVLITLHTGRHHQIRVQCASRGLAIYGDRKYNPIWSGKDRKPGGKTGRPAAGLGLYSTRVSFCHPLTGERMTFKTDPEGEAFDRMDVEAY